MGQVIKITVPGKPIAKARPRFAIRKTRSGKQYSHAYNCQETEEGKFMLLVKNQLSGHELIEGAVTLFAIFHMPIPKSTSKRLSQLMREGKTKHIKKPDSDNLIKFVKDCMNGIVWKDDSQVFDVHAIKQYSDQPRTEIYINEV